MIRINDYLSLHIGQGQGQGQGQGELISTLIWDPIYIEKRLDRFLRRHVIEYPVVTKAIWTQYERAVIIAYDLPAINIELISLENYLSKYKYLPESLSHLGYTLFTSTIKYMRWSKGTVIGLWAIPMGGGIDDNNTYFYSLDELVKRYENIYGFIPSKSTKFIAGQEGMPMIKILT